MDVDWGDLDALRRDRPALVLEAMAAGDADTFRRALTEGFDPNVAGDAGGSERTPLHHAAAAGDVAALQLLLDHGAAPSLEVEDPTYGATPLGWAEFLDQPEAAEFLRSVTDG